MERVFQVAVDGGVSFTDEVAEVNFVGANADFVVGIVEHGKAGDAEEKRVSVAGLVGRNGDIHGASALGIRGRDYAARLCRDR